MEEAQHLLLRRRLEVDEQVAAADVLRQVIEEALERSEATRGRADSHDVGRRLCHFCGRQRSFAHEASALRTRHAEGEMTWK